MASMKSPSSLSTSIPNLAEKILLALFVKNAELNDESSEENLLKLYDHTFPKISPMKPLSLKPYSDVEYLKHLSSPPSEINEIPFFVMKFLIKKSELPPLSGYTTVTYRDDSTQKVYAYANCGSTSLMNFLDIIFSDNETQSFNIDAYKDKLGLAE